MTTVRRAAPATEPGTAAAAAAPGARRATAAVWLLTAAVGGAAAGLTVAGWDGYRGHDAVWSLADLPAALLYASLGGLIVRRAANLIGWMLLGLAVALSVMALASAWAVLGVRHPGTLPAPRLLGLLAEWTFVPVLAGLAFLFLLYPTGRLPSRRWRPFAAAGLTLTGLAMVGVLVHPRQMALPAPGGVSLFLPNPLGIRSLGPVLSRVLIGTLAGASALFVVLLGGAIVALVIRYRSGSRETRQQIKWIVLIALAAVVCQAVALLALGVDHGRSSLVVTIAYTVIPVIALFGIPAVITLAILKHGLYQIDVIISRAVQYGLLSAVLTGVYVAIVIGIGTLAGYSGGGSGLSVAAAVAVALLFQPVRQRAQRIANRLVYGERASPYQVLADFAEDMGGQLDAGLVLDRMAAVLAGATGALQVGVWICVGGELRPQVVWPRESGTAPTAAVPVVPAPPAGATVTGGPAPAGGLGLADGPGSGSGPGPAGGVPVGAAAGLPDLGPVSRAVAVRHSGELLGVLTVVKPPTEPVSAAEDKLLAQLASQAGLVLRNARLTAELQATIDDLRASRRRLVQAQDAERQRIERNLHDGAQQQLVALRIQLGLLDAVAGDPAEVRTAAGQLRDGLAAALDDLRALARGIYPPLLADQGLGAALRAQASRAALPVAVAVDGVGRYPRETEAAVYFCILEALQNTAKYAGANTASVALAASGGQLEFTVTDD
ncbi:MAG TPA: histidine kinase, partial [Streptosporangiaceae bacterium]|nr:histidine kinase [Streptosporangiaceae bacterium]